MTCTQLTAAICTVAAAAADTSVNINACRYVQATAFKAPYRESFGYPLMYNISGTLHTHVLAWKVDLDIGGTQNSVNIHHMKVSHSSACSCWRLRISNVCVLRLLDLCIALS
jgi:hypothetical protein